MKKFLVCIILFSVLFLGGCERKYIDSDREASVNSGWEVVRSGEIDKFYLIPDGEYPVCKIFIFRDSQFLCKYLYNIDSIKEGQVGTLYRKFYLGNYYYQWIEKKAEKEQK